MQASVGKSHTLCGQPLAVVIADSRPCAQLLAGVVLLTVVFVVAADGTVAGQLPVFLVAAHGLFRPVGILDDEVQPHLGIAELHNLVRLVILAHGVVASVAQDHADGVVGSQHRGHVERVVEHRTPVIRRCGSQHLVAHLPAVDEQFVKPQTGDVQGGTLDAGFRLELRAEIACAQPTVCHLLVPGKGCIPAYPTAGPVGLSQQAHAP